MIVIYASEFLLLIFFGLKEILHCHKKIAFFFLVQMQTIPLPEPLFVEFLWISQQPHTVKRVGVRPLSKSRYIWKLSKALWVCVCVVLRIKPKTCAH
jgi:hypothetical protein